MSVKINADGSRTIHLFLPVASIGEAVTLRPVRLDDVVRWQAGEIASPMALLALLSEVSESFLGQLNYPDAERVLSEFLAHLPPALATEISRAAQIGFPQRVSVEQGPDTMQPEPAPGFEEEGDDPDLGLRGV